MDKRVEREISGKIITHFTYNLARVRAYSDKEERANTLSHAVGILLGVVAGFFLLPKAADDSDPWKVVSVLVYLFCMLFCYIASTVYHNSKDKIKKGRLQKLDHASIPVHIAGTYTPFTLIVLRQVPPWGWLLFAFVWLSAIVGIFLSMRRTTTHSHLETICYIAMGCSIVIALKPLITTLNNSGTIDALYWLLGGGASYIIGALFYSLANKKYMHTVFHFFVLGGSICHIIAIYIIL